MYMRTQHTLVVILNLGQIHEMKQVFKLTRIGIHYNIVKPISCILYINSVYIDSLPSTIVLTTKKLHSYICDE